MIEITKELDDYICNKVRNTLTSMTNEIKELDRAMSDVATAAIETNKSYFEKTLKMIENKNVHNDTKQAYIVVENGQVIFKEGVTGKIISFSDIKDISVEIFSDNIFEIKDRYDTSITIQL